MDPGFLSFRIPDPTRTKWRSVGNFFVVQPFCGHTFHKFENYLVFEKVQTKFEPNDKNSSIFKLKINTKLSEKCV
jgi:hypothetical protein